VSKANLPQYDCDTIIIGGGPGGYTAGIYAARSGLKSLLVEGASTVSQITITDLIENYPGIPDGINGFDLMQLFKKQAQNFGLEIIANDVHSIKKAGDNPAIWEIAVGDKSYRTLSVIAATGAQWNKLGVPGEEEFAGKGVSYCATCDGPFYRNAELIVVGGGNAAIQEALYLTKFARRVTVIHRRDKLRAQPVLQERAFKNEKIRFIWDSVVSNIFGAEQVEGVEIRNVKSGEKISLPAEGVFIFIGWVPNTEFVRGLVNLDDDGHIITDAEMHTNVPGIIAVGDVRSKPFRQIANAVGDGAVGALSASKYLEGLHN